MTVIIYFSKNKNWSQKLENHTEDMKTINSIWKRRKYMKWIFNYGGKILNKKQNNLQFQEITSIILKKHAQNKLKQIDNQEKIEAFLVELDLCAKITEGIVEINKNSVGMYITFTFEEIYILNDNEFFNTKLMMQLALELSESIVFTVEKERIKMTNYIRFCR